MNATSLHPVRGGSSAHPPLLELPGGWRRPAFSPLSGGATCCGGRADATRTLSGRGHWSHHPSAATRVHTPRKAVAQRLALGACGLLSVVRIHPARAALDLSGREA